MRNSLGYGLEACAKFGSFDFACSGFAGWQAKVPQKCGMPNAGKP